MIIRSNCFCLCILICCFFYTKAYSSTNEKVFVQLNNSIFITGEKLYYKAFIVNASTFQKCTENNIIFFELLSQSGKRCMSWRSNALNGMASGNISIPDTLSGGVYTFKAYSNQMKISDDAFYFATNILITKLREKELKSLLIQVPSHDLQKQVSFLADGGSLVANTNCKVGVRVNKINPSMYPMQGIVKDNNDNPICNFQTDAFGLAEFSFIPQLNNSYKAFVTNNENITTAYTLPEVSKSGFQINEILENKVNGFQITYHNAEKSASHPCKLLLSIRDKSLLDTLLVFIPGIKNVIRIDKKTTSGIVDIKVIEGKDKIIHEKLFYIDYADSFSELPIAPRSVYQQGEHIRLPLKFNTEEKSETFLLSVSIAQKNSFTFLETNQSMQQFLSFYSEITESYMFPNENDSFSISLANKYLQTVTPEDYYWNKSPKAQQKECTLGKYGYLLSGQLQSTNKDDSIANQPVCISATDSFPHFKHAYTDSAGNFSFALDTSYDNKKLILQLFKPLANPYKWKMKTEVASKNPNSCTEYALSFENINFLDNFRKFKLAEMVFSNPENKTIITQSQNSIKVPGDFSLMPHATVFPSDYTEIENFRDILQNLLPFVKLRNKETGFYIFDPEFRVDFKKAATVFLNGIPFYDIENLLELKAKEITKIELNYSKVMYGELTFNGIISIVTTNLKIPEDYLNRYAKLINNDVQPNTSDVIFDTQEVEKIRSDGFPDLRNTLYINQSLSISDNNVHLIEFITSNLKDTYTLRIAGISSFGKIISQKFNFSVK